MEEIHSELGKVGRANNNLFLLKCSIKIVNCNALKAAGG